MAIYKPNTVNKHRARVCRLCVGQTNAKTNVKTLRSGVQCCVGTCGRLVQLINAGALNLSKIELFILDEADRLIEEDCVRDIKYERAFYKFLIQSTIYLSNIFSALPQTKKQVVVFSSAFPAHIEETLQQHMREPAQIKFSVEEPPLAMMEYIVLCDRYNKAENLLCLLRALIFTQCVIFCESAKM